MLFSRKDRLVILAALLLVAGCALAPVLSSEQRAAQWADGVYEGEAKSFPSRAQVRVTIEGGRIASVEVLENVTTLSDKSYEQELPKRIVEAQTTEVDAISGATNSCRVILTATQQALDKAAGAEPPAPEPATEPEPTAEPAADAGPAADAAP